MYPAAPDWNSAAPLSGWYLLNGAQPRTCGWDGWGLLLTLQSELSARIADAGSLPSFDVTVNSVPFNDPANPAGAIGWNSDMLRALYAVAQSIGAPSSFLSAIQADAQRGSGPISPATLQTGIWIGNRLNHRFQSDGTEIWNAGSPSDVSIPNGTNYPLMDVAPPVTPSTAAGSSCNAISTAEANLIPVVRTVSPFTFSEVLIFGILLVAVGAVVVMSRDIPVTGRGGVRKNPRERIRSFSPEWEQTMHEIGNKTATRRHTDLLLSHAESRRLQLDGRFEAEIRRKAQKIANNSGMSVSVMGFVSGVVRRQRLGMVHPR